MESLVVFTIATLLVCLAPGPDNLYVLTQSALQGRLAGVVITLGLCTGLVAHTTAVALGLAALLASSTLAFAVLKTLGAVYLLYLAWQAFSSGAGSLSSSDTAKPSYRGWYFRGVIMNISNPKVSLFFLAFLPQFVETGSEQLPAQLLLLGGLVIIVTLITFSTIACLAGLLSAWLKQSPRNQRLLNSLADTVFAGLAVKLLLSSAE